MKIPPQKTHPHLIHLMEKRSQELQLTILEQGFQTVQQQKHMFGDRQIVPSGVACEDPVRNNIATNLKNIVGKPMYHNNSDIHKQSQTRNFRVSWEICLWIECCHVLPLFIFSSLIISRSDSDSGLEFWFEVLVSELARGLKQPTIITFAMETKSHPIKKDNHLPNLHFWVPCVLSGVYNPWKQRLSLTARTARMAWGCHWAFRPPRPTTIPCRAPLVALSKGVLYILPALLQFWVGEPSHPI